MLLTSISTITVLHIFILRIVLVDWDTGNTAGRLLGVGVSSLGRLAGLGQRERPAVACRPYRTVVCGLRISIPVVAAQYYSRQTVARMTSASPSAEIVSLNGASAAAATDSGSSRTKSPADITI